MLAERLKLLALFATVAFGGFSIVSAVTNAAAADDLEGTWSGSGTVTYASSGDKERARCRATFRKATANSYSVSGSCATQSGKASQTAEVFKLTENRYRGNFYNQEFDISGTMSVIVRGRSLTATLTSSTGTGVLNLSH